MHYDSFIQNPDIKQEINYTTINLGNIMRVEQNLANKIEGVLSLIDKE